MDLKKKILEALVLKRDVAKNKIVVRSDAADPNDARKETMANIKTFKSLGMRWDGQSWGTGPENFEALKKALETINKKELLISRLEDIEEFVNNSETITGGDVLKSKIGMYINDLMNAVDEAAMSAEIKRYLSFYASYKTRSFTNTMLIYIQRPTATNCQGFSKWQTHYGRRVKKGAKGILIWVLLGKGNEDDDDDSGLDKDVSKGSSMRFGPRYVFDIEDTEEMSADEIAALKKKNMKQIKGNKAARPVTPALPEWYANQEVTEISEQIFDIVKEIATDMGIDVTQHAAKRGENGYSAGGHINLSSPIKSAPQASTIIHELAHELMHHKATSPFFQGDDVRADSGLCELHADSVAYVVMKHYGLPVTKHPTYIALWKGNREKIEANLEAITEVADFIMQQIDVIAHANNTTKKAEKKPEEKLAIAENKK